MNKAGLLKADKLGAVYTPELLSEWAAELLHSAIRPGTNGLILDPACGDGALLNASWKHTRRKVLGVDCDPEAIKSTKARLSHASLKLEDGLIYLADLSDGSCQDKIAGVIANPPWGAELQSTKAEIRRRGYLLASGQFDTWDLFVEGIIKAAPHGTAAVLILPDAIFLPEHKPVRRLLASKTTILNIARLGEGFFPGVFRGTAVISFRKAQSNVDCSISCLRISQSQREMVLRGDMSLSEVAAKYSHPVPQRRFTEDPECRFDIDMAERERPQVELIERAAFPWDDFTYSGRGMEISKSGIIHRCPACGEPKAPSRNMNTEVCGRCCARWKSSPADAESIIRDRKIRAPSGWHDMIVGEDVDRHRCLASRIIRMRVPGIDYKQDSVFSQPKLLIRKTGVGIKAAVDESGARTNQVVFHFLARPGAPDGLLDYLQAVLCSRILLAWHLKKQGDSEWRSHPYVTQKIIKTFPVKIPGDGLAGKRAKELILLARMIRRNDTTHDEFIAMDLRIERLVAEIIGLNRVDFRWVLNVLDSADDLEPIRTLRIDDIGKIFP
jgi:adenine-specific DNA-methyltransferase